MLGMRSRIRSLETLLLQKSLESAARLDAKFWAHQRQNVALLYRGKAKQSTIDAVKSELSDILDQRIIIYPPTLLGLGIDWYSTFEQRKEVLNVSTNKPTYTDKEKKFLQTMQTKAEHCRKANWQWRISEEAEQKQKLGWYPFFITLTVNPQWTEPEKFWREGREFRKFIRRMCKVVTSELGEPPAHKKTKDYGYRPESDYITYAAVIEHGASREHHHCHMLVWMREIPDGWKQCPNRFVANKDNRTFNECCSMRRLWKWSLPGLSKFNYYRTLGDVWKTKHNFATPVDPETRKPLNIAPVFVAGRYITKYLQKDHKEWHHRMKCTRNLGMKRLMKVVKSLDPAIVKALTWRPQKASQLHSLSLIHSAPLGLVRLLAKQRHYLNRYISNPLDLKEQLKNNSMSFPAMLRSVRLGARPDRMHSLDFFDWVSQHLQEEKEFCEQKLVRAHSKLSKHFPRVKTRIDKPIIQSGANIGLACSL